MNLSHTINADAKAAVDFSGEPVTYIRAGGSPKEINAIPNVPGLESRETDGGNTLGFDITLAVAKLDIETVTKNGDKVEVPGAWLGTDGRVSLRVAEVNNYHARPGCWIIGLAKGR